VPELFDTSAEIVNAAPPATGFDEGPVSEM